MPGRLADLEPAQPLRLFLVHLDILDIRPPRPTPHERDQAVDGIVLALEHGLDGAVGW
jgi:hypothetical protein